MAGAYKSVEREAIGLHEAVWWIKEMGLVRVIIEMDAKLMVDAVNRSAVVNSMFGSIIERYRVMLHSQPHYTVNWISRDANIVAHHLARNSRDYSSPYYWVERPDFVDNLSNSACSC